MLLKRMIMNQSRFSKWFRVAISPSVMKRSACYAVVVGALLILINHGPCVLNDMYTLECLLQSILSVIVPYMVVTISSVQVTIANEYNRGRLE